MKPIVFKVFLVLATLVFGSTHAVADTVLLKTVATIDIDIPGGANGMALTVEDSSLWVGAQSVRQPSVVARYDRRGQLIDKRTLGSQGNVGGLAFDGISLHVLDYATSMRSGSHAMYRCKKDGSLERARSASGGPHNARGLAWSENGFFQGHSPTVKRQSVIHKLDAQGREQTRVTLPFYTSGMAWHDGKLWVTTGRYSELYVLDADLSIIGSFALDRPMTDIAFVDGELWGLGWNRSELYQLDVSGLSPKRPQSNWLALIAAAR